MGVCIQFETARPVDRPVAEKVLSEVDAVNAGRDWLVCEPLHFYPPEKDGRLRGASKLHLLPHPDEREAFAEVDEEDSDLHALVDALCRWSREHALVWQVSVEGERLGRIAGGVCEEGLYGAIEALAGLAGELGEMAEEEPEARPGLRIWREPEEE